MIKKITAGEERGEERWVLKKGRVGMKWGGVHMRGWRIRVWGGGKGSRDQQNSESDQI